MADPFNPLYPYDPAARCRCCGFGSVTTSPACRFLVVLPFDGQVTYDAVSRQCTNCYHSWYEQPPVEKRALKMAKAFLEPSPAEAPMTFDIGPPTKSVCGVNVCKHCGRP